MKLHWRCWVRGWADARTSRQGRSNDAAAAAGPWYHQYCCAAVTCTALALRMECRAGVLMWLRGSDVLGLDTSTLHCVSARQISTPRQPHHHRYTQTLSSTCHICTYLHWMLTDFQHFFTGGIIRGKLTMKWLLNISSRVHSVATIPCEINRKKNLQ